MGFVVWLALAAGTLLVFSAQRGLSPVDTLKAILNGEKLPDVKYLIETGGPIARRLTPQGLETTSVSASGMLRPVPGAVGDGFGAPRDGGARRHEGVDLLSGMGTPVHAAAAGRVVAAEWHSGYGNVVYIDHGNGLQTRYAHLSKFGTRVGVNVSQGDVVGYVGSTGNSSGPHLHFEVRVNGTAVDPLKYITR